MKWQAVTKLRVVESHADNWSCLSGLAKFPLRSLEKLRGELSEGKVGTERVSSYVAQVHAVVQLMERRPYTWGSLSSIPQFAWHMDNGVVIVTSPRLELLAASTLWVHLLLASGDMDSTTMAARVMRWIALPQALVMRHTRHAPEWKLTLHATRNQLALVLLRLQVVCVSRWEQRDNNGDNTLGSGMMEWILQTCGFLRVSDLPKICKRRLESLERETRAVQLLVVPHTTETQRQALILAALDEFRTMGNTARIKQAESMIPSTAHGQACAEHSVIAAIGLSSIEQLSEPIVFGVGGDPVDYTKDIGAIG